ncbi:Imm10 family immunity protein [Streptomyces peucetius]|nr:hypothetical protein CGZ69_00465 [Streptomyces peucetius subsp. caesius ATCC 27952]
MATRWPIRKVHAEENVPDSCFIFGMSEDEMGEGRYLIFQSGLREPTPQQQRLGLDSYCILNEEDGQCFGGVEEVVVSEQSLHLSLTEEAASELGVADRSFDLTIEADGGGREVYEGLRRALAWGNPELHPRRVEFRTQG